jgi:hypothetical protein
MIIELSTPALSFPAISMRMLAYTHRTLTLANHLRDVHAWCRKEVDVRTLRPGDLEDHQSPR